MGVSGTPQATGYKSTAQSETSTTGLLISNLIGTIARNVKWQYTLTHVGSNKWNMSGLYYHNGSGISFCFGYVTFSGACDLVGIYAETADNFTADAWRVTYWRSA